MHLGFTSDLKLILSEEELVEKITWLQNHIDFWPEVEKLWADTSKKRISNLLADTSVTDYIESFKILKHETNGPKLVRL